MLHYIDCSAGFVNSTDVIKSLMPDGLHPTNVGMEMLAQVRQHHTSNHCMSQVKPQNRCRFIPRTISLSSASLARKVQCTPLRPVFQLLPEYGHVQ